jgi:hypothetical protein
VLQCDADHHSGVLEPNELCAALHNHMPVVLKPESWPVAWGAAGGCIRAQGPACAVSIRGDDMLAGERAGGNVKNNDATLIEPIAA